MFLIILLLIAISQSNTNIINANDINLSAIPSDVRYMVIKDEELAKADVVGESISVEELKSSANIVEDTNLNIDTLTDGGLFEGDIVGSYDELKDRNAIVDNAQKWPGKEIPYIISSTFNSQEREIIARAMQLFHDKTCIRFKGRTSETGYIHIFKGHGCYSRVGRSGKEQMVSIGSGCDFSGIILHELIHALGFWHEQSRTDRDKYVKINYENIITGKEHNFDKFATHEITDLKAPYDTCSIMHYGANTFSKNRRPTITVIKSSGKCTIGQRTSLSPIDIKKLNTLYKCTGHTQVGDASTTPRPNYKCKDRDCKPCAGDKNVNCPLWVRAGYCIRQFVSFMKTNCATSCGC